MWFGKSKDSFGEVKACLNRLDPPFRCQYRFWHGGGGGWLMCDSQQEFIISYILVNQQDNGVKSIINIMKYIFKTPTQPQFKKT